VWYFWPAVVAAALAVNNEEAEVCGMVGDLEVEERECRAGTPRTRLASTDPDDKTFTVPRSRKTTLTLQMTATSFNWFPGNMFCPKEKGVAPFMVALHCHYHDIYLPHRRLFRRRVCLWITSWRQFKSDYHQTTSVIPLATGDGWLNFKGQGRTGRYALYWTPF